MKDNKKISVIIPTLNEEKNMPILLKKIPDYVDEIIVIDSHSKDKTVEVSEKHGANVYLVGKGKGRAIIKGVKESSGDYVIIVDADLSHDPKEIELFISALNIGNDLCLGSRFIQGGGSEDITFIRKIGNKFFIKFINFLFRKRFTDVCYGYRAFKRDSFNKLNLKASGFSIEVELIIKAIKKNMNIIEIPSYEKERKYGKTKLNSITDGLKILKEIFICYFKY